MVSESFISSKYFRLNQNKTELGTKTYLFSCRSWPSWTLFQSTRTRPYPTRAKLNFSQLIIMLLGRIAIFVLTLMLTSFLAMQFESLNLRQELKHLFVSESFTSSNHCQKRSKTEPSTKPYLFSSKSKAKLNFFRLITLLLVGIAIFVLTSFLAMQASLNLNRN